MKEIILSAAVFCAVCAVTSCGNTQAKTIVRENMLADSVEEAVDICYDAACSYLSYSGKDVSYDSLATDEKKLAVIRQADLLDDTGDVMPEVPEYDVIETILWPCGYGNY